MERKIFFKFNFLFQIIIIFSPRDATTANEKVLISLGATIESSFGDNCTHLIWSNGLSRRNFVASMLGIYVVSPLWIEQCKESGTKWPEADFSCDSADLSFPSARTSLLNRKVDAAVEKLPVEQPKNNFQTNGSKRNSISVGKLSDLEQKQENIPIPSYKQVHIKPLPTAEERLRRSERISELDSDDDDDDNEGEKIGGLAQANNENVSLESVLAIDPNAPIPVVCSEKWPPDDIDEILAKKKTLVNAAESAQSVVKITASKTTKKISLGVVKVAKENDSNSTTRGISIAVTGFDGPSGERNTILGLLQDIGRQMEGKSKFCLQVKSRRKQRNSNASTGPDESSASKGGGSVGRLDLLTGKVEINAEEESVWLNRIIDSISMAGGTHATKDGRSDSFQVSVLGPLASESGHCSVLVANEESSK